METLMNGPPLTCPLNGDRDKCVRLRLEIRRQPDHEHILAERIGHYQRLIFRRKPIGGYRKRVSVINTVRTFLWRRRKQPVSAQSDRSCV
jgi:hypothetical protein